VTLRRGALVLALIAALAAALIVVVLHEQGVGKGGATSPAAPGEAVPISVATTLDPRVLLFGDTLKATVDVTYSRRRVNGDSIRITPQFAPWALIQPPHRERRDAGAVGFLRTTYVLRCTIGPCVPQGAGTSSLEFDPVRISFRPAARKGRPRSFVTHWPVLVSHSQIVSDDFENQAAINSPWRADAVTLPAVSYRVSPRVVRAVAFGLGALLAVVGIILAVLAIPARAPRPEPEPEPEPKEPEPVLAPLEHALVLLEAEVRSNGGADQRRALELIAEELEARDFDAALARRARNLAWSEDVPPAVQTRGLATEVRAALVVDEPAQADETIDGEEGDAPPA
jgi:hypothetical protein